MPKTVEQIKAEVTSLVKSQGNQGAISLGTVLDDITELAGEGGGGGSTPNVIQVSMIDDADWAIDNPDDLASFAEKAEQGELVMIKFEQAAGFTIEPIAYGNFGAQKQFKNDSISVKANGVLATRVVIDVEQKTITIQPSSYPSN